MREALSQDREETVSVTGLNLEHARAPGLIKTIAPRRGRSSSRLETRQDRVIKKHEKEEKEPV